MNSVNKLFSKYTNLIENFALKTNKKIEFKFYSNDVKVDKIIMDFITEPLFHVITNSIAHGIEKPALRVKNNKPETGLIKVCAAHKNDKILISIYDDGRGIACDLLKKKAVQSNFLSKKDADILTTAKAMELIFLNGLTTKQHSFIAGRGRGMDIVKKMMAYIDGKVKIKSEPGRYTRITFVVPLFLSELKINAIPDEVLKKVQKIATTMQSAL